MNKYKLVTSNDQSIYGHDFLDAIKNNIPTLTTWQTFDRATKERGKKIVPHDEIYAQYSDGILGGKGGAIIIMRGNNETNTAWLGINLTDWLTIAQEGETIRVL